MSLNDFTLNIVGCLFVHCYYSLIVIHLYLYRSVLISLRPYRQTIMKNIR